MLLSDPGRFVCCGLHVIAEREAVIADILAGSGIAAHLGVSFRGIARAPDFDPAA
jgi:hypothetical protein